MLPTSCERWTLSFCAMARSSCQKASSRLTLVLWPPTTSDRLTTRERRCPSDVPFWDPFVRKEPPRCPGDRNVTTYGGYITLTKQGGIAGAAEAGQRFSGVVLPDGMTPELAARLESLIAQYVDEACGEGDPESIELPFRFGITLFREIAENLHSL